eukprot:scaffold58627_cov57-Attheya_sp.AAC.2
MNNNKRPTMAPSTPTTTPHVSPIRSRLEDDDTRKRKAIATPPRMGLPGCRHAFATTTWSFYILLAFGGGRGKCLQVGWVDL